MSPNLWRRLLETILTTCIVVLALTVATPAQRPTPPGNPQTGEGFPDESSTPLGRKQKKELLKYNLKNMRNDAAEMARLANSIQEDLEKTTENEMPLKVVEKAEQVEKLAKKIKNRIKGF